MTTSRLLTSIGLLALLSACTPAAPNGAGSSSSSSEASSDAASSMTANSIPGWQSYGNPDEGYALEYPADVSLETNKLTIVANTTGAVLHFPKNFQPGTAYEEAYIEITTQPQPCKPITSIAMLRGTSQRTINGVTYITQSGSDVGAGNLYQTYDVTAVQNNLCHRFDLTVHSCNLGPDCGTGHTQKLEMQAFLNLFNQILSTVQYAGQMSSAASSSVMATAIDTTAGTLFTITLDSNPTTGYSWNAAYDKSLLTLSSSSYVPPSSSALGAGGQEQFTFKALKHGSATITFSYARSWEKNVPPIQTRVYTVNMK